MTVDHHQLYVDARSGDAASGTALQRFLRALAPQDYVVCAFLLFLNLAVLDADPSAERTRCLLNIGSLFVFHGACVVAVRSGVLTHRFLSPLLYRVATYGGVQLTYFMFAELLPVVNHRSLDHGLYQLDLTCFGVEPAAYFDRFVTPATTEWFAFFYFGYFLLLALHVLPILFLVKNARVLGEFALGMILLFCIGHTLYVLVPGYGPYRAMPELFAHGLPSGLWWDLTRKLVATSGAQKDIFPSLHTAAPTLLLLYSFHRRGEIPFRYSWPFVGFFAVNIVLATMFLRWHYVIDVVAGLLLAITAHTLSVWLTGREIDRRESLGLGPAWPEWGTRVARGKG